jgi:ribosomal protein S18 acetylase RimI-like enzyme
MLVGYDWKRQAQSGRTSVRAYFKAAGLFGAVAVYRRAMTGPVNLLDEHLPEGCYYISDISVRPEFRGKGIGSKLIASAEKEAVAEGCRTIRLAVWYDNPAAKRLYERLGFREYGRREGRYRGRFVGFYHLEKPLSFNI